jgi:hypothetical protein
MATKQIFGILIFLLSVPCFANPTETANQDRKALFSANTDISVTAQKIIRQLQDSTERTLERRSHRGQALNAIHEVFKVSKKDLKVNSTKVLTSADPTSDLSLIASRIDVKQLRASGAWIATSGNLLTIIFESSHFEEDFIGALIDPRQAFSEILSHAQIVDSSGNVVAGSAISPFLNAEVRDFFSVNRGGAQSVQNSGSSRGMIWQWGNLPFAFVTEKSFRPVATLSNETLAPKILTALLLVILSASLLYWSDKQNQLSVGDAMERLFEAKTEIQLEKNWILNTHKEIVAGEPRLPGESNEIPQAPSHNESPNVAERSSENFQ